MYSVSNESDFITSNAAPCFANSERKFVQLLRQKLTRLINFIFSGREIIKKPE